MTLQQAALTHFETAASSRSQGVVRFEVLDSWRGICALLVALFHFPAASVLSQSRFIASSYLFVDFFFVLSGFVIAAGYAGRLNTATDGMKFAAIRLGRVYPLHFLMITAFAGFELMRLLVPALRGGGETPFTGSFDLPILAGNLLLLQGMNVFDHLTWNMPSWSISTEFFTYLAFAVVMIVLGSRAWVVLAVTAVLATISLWRAGAPDMNVTYDYGFLRCIAGFSVGALIAHFQYSAIVEARANSSDMMDRLLWTVAEAVMIFAIVCFVANTGQNQLSLTAPFVFGLALMLFAHEGGLVSSLLRGRPFLLLGALSYSIYMVHTFVLIRMYNVAVVVDRKLDLGLVGKIVHHGTTTVGFGPDSQFIALGSVLSMCVLVVLCAWLTYRFVEMPALTWVKRRVSGR